MLNFRWFAFPLLLCVGLWGNSAQPMMAQELTFGLMGKIKDQSTTGVTNELYRNFRGSFSYDQKGVDQDPTTNQGSFALSDFDIQIKNQRQNNSLEITPNLGWQGKLELTSVSTEAGNPLYALIFERGDQSGEGVVFMRLTWDWNGEADTSPLSIPKGQVRPNNSFLREAFGPTTESQFYPIQSAQITPSVPGLW